MSRAFFALIAISLFSVPALAQEDGCGPRPAIVEQLEGQYGETKQSQGLIDKDTILEIFRSDKTGTWTIILSNKDGNSCVMASGGFWVYDPERAPEI